MSTASKPEKPRCTSLKRNKPFSWSTSYRRFRTLLCCLLILDLTAVTNEKRQDLPMCDIQDPDVSLSAAGGAYESR